jgi:hypothetical protein
MVGRVAYDVVYSAVVVPSDVIDIIVVIDQFDVGVEEAYDGVKRRPGSRLDLDDNSVAGLDRAEIEHIHIFGRTNTSEDEGVSRRTELDGPRRGRGVIGFGVRVAVTTGYDRNAAAKQELAYGSQPEKPAKHGIHEFVLARKCTRIGDMRHRPHGRLNLN